MLTFTPWISVRWTDNCVLGSGEWLVQQFDGVNQEISTNLPPLCHSWCVVIAHLSMVTLTSVYSPLLFGYIGLLKQALSFTLRLSPQPKVAVTFWMNVLPVVLLIYAD